MKDHMLWTKENKEIAQLDRKLLIVEAEDEDDEPSVDSENDMAGSLHSDRETSDQVVKEAIDDSGHSLVSLIESEYPTAVAYPAALEKAELDLELWH